MVLLADPDLVASLVVQARKDRTYGQANMAIIFVNALTYQKQSWN